MNDNAEIIFSLRDGRVVASWANDEHTRVNLGDFNTVADAMNDFMRQCEVAASLLDKTEKGPYESRRCTASFKDAYESRRYCTLVRFSTIPPCFSPV